MEPKEEEKLFRALEFSANSNQNCSNAFSGGLSSGLPAIIAAFTPPIDVPATISNFRLLSASALNTPHPKAPDEPPPCIISTFSTELVVNVYLLLLKFLILVISLSSYDY